MMKLGLLLPTSRIYPSLQTDFLSGIRLAFKETNVKDEIDIMFQGIDNGSDVKLIIDELNKMTLQNEAAINIVFTNPSFVDEISKASLGMQRPTIVTNIGGNVPNFKFNSPYTLINSLNLWESANAASKFGIKKFGNKTGHGSYFYEAGYQLYESFFQEFEKNKGEILFNQIAGLNPDPNDFEILIQKYKEHNPHFLHLLYSERDAVTFLNKLVNSESNGSLPIVTSGVMLNEEILNKVSKTPKNIYNVCSWDKSLKNEINEKFVANIKEASGNDANYFSLLGYECGMAIALAYQRESWSKNGLDQYNTIKNNTFMGPRGKVDFLTNFGTTQFDNIAFTLDENGNTLQYSNLGKIQNATKLIEETYHKQQINGWLQPYLVN